MVLLLLDPGADYNSSPIMKELPMLWKQVLNPALTIPYLAEYGGTLAHAFYRRLQGDSGAWAFSFNLSDRCPINCDCYWRAQNRVTELTDNEVAYFFNEKRDQGYLHVNIIGGEPYVRPDLLERVCGILPFSWVVTSGTTPLRKLRHATQVISIDGATAETHNAVRKSKGLYERIVKNVSKAKQSGIGPLFIHTVLNHVNHRQIGEILKVWSENGLVQGVLVSTLTPIKGAGDDGLRLLRSERAWIVEELHRLKLIYGDFLMLTEAMIDRLHPEHTAGLNPEICSTARLIESFDAAGERIKQCILSEKADCTECGCVVTIMSESSPKHPYRELLESMRYFGRMTSIAS